MEKKNIFEVFEADKKTYTCASCGANWKLEKTPKKCPGCDSLIIYEINKEKIIFIEVYRGCVTDVRGLPPGYKYKIEDHDV